MFSFLGLGFGFCCLGLEFRVWDFDFLVFGMGSLVRNFVVWEFCFGFCLWICSLVFMDWNDGVWDIEFWVFGIGF